MAEALLSPYSEEKLRQDPASFIFPLDDDPLGVLFLEIFDSFDKVSLFGPSASMYEAFTHTTKTIIKLAELALTVDEC